jgi:ectoine hydroxylase
MNLKRYKPLHWLYNLLHYRSLRHNRQAYHTYQLKKPLIASLSSADFPDKESKAWLDINDSRSVAAEKKEFVDFNPLVREKILSWSENGYMILENFFSQHECDRINGEIQRMLGSKKVHLQENGKIMFANRKSRIIADAANYPSLVQILAFLLGQDVHPFQTINFIRGSEQRAHSDSIHMTTYPLGYLIAAWIALEDVHDSNGPLFYYPGSHKLPFLLNSGFNEGESFLTLGKNDYSDYEDVIEKLVAKNDFKKVEFHARKGDVLIWHANLVHGGAPILDARATRKSMVVHYYAKDVIKYHEITERPALMH